MADGPAGPESPTTRPPAGDGRVRWHRVRFWAVRALIAEATIVLVIVIWWLSARELSPHVLPGPWQVGQTIVALLQSPSFHGHMWASVGRVFLAVAVALVLGLGLAVLPRVLPIFQHIVHQRILPVLNSFPSLGWALLAMIWFGVSDFSVVFVQVMILVPFCLINLDTGLKEMDRDLVEMGRSFTRHRRRLAITIMLPLLAPYLMSALRIAYGIGWKVSLVAELFGARTGLGFQVAQAQANAQPDRVLAICLIIVGIYLLGELLILRPLSRLVRRYN